MLHDVLCILYTCVQTASECTRVYTCSPPRLLSETCRIVVLHVIIQYLTAIVQSASRVIRLGGVLAVGGASSV